MLLSAPTHLAIMKTAASHSRWQIVYMLARSRCLPYDEGTDFRFCFYRNQGAKGCVQICICCADSKTLGDKGSFPEGFLTHPAVFPSASCIQLTDLQLSQEQMISLFSLLNPPFTPKGFGMPTGPTRHGVHRSIWQLVPSCQRESKLAGACLSPSPAPMSRSSL